MDKIISLLETGEDSNLKLAFTLAYYSLELSIEEIAQLWIDWNFEQDVVGGSLYEWFMLNGIKYTVFMHESHDNTEDWEFHYQFNNHVRQPFSLRLPELDEQIKLTMVSRIIQLYFKSLKE